MNQEFDQFFESDSSSDDEPVDLGNTLLKISDESMDAYDFSSYFVITENPPLNKTLRKRKRDEAKEETQRKLYQFEKNENINALRNMNGDDNDDDDRDNADDCEANHNTSDDDEIPSKKFRRGGNLPSDISDCGSVGSEDPIESDDGDWNMMGAALEREFLGLE